MSLIYTSKTLNFKSIVSLRAAEEKKKKFRINRNSTKINKQKLTLEQKSDLENFKQEQKENLKEFKTKQNRILKEFKKYSSSLI